MDHAVSLSHDRDNQQDDLPHKAAGGDSVRENDNNNSAAQVAEHYNQRRQLGVHGRMHTKITGLRLFNNWIKSIMIRKFAYNGCRVLDLGCGKGGDLRKWAIAGISEYIGMDIAQTSVSQAQKRFEEMRNTQFSAKFFAQDCYADPLENTMRPSDYQADVISAQFCLHYAFETEKKARQMMHNVSSHLADGGVFICTIPNANWLVVDFAEDASKIKRFGTAYAFTLDEAVEDCTEYLVHIPTFIELAKEHGLELEYCRDFHNLFADHISDYSSVELLRRMRVVDSDRPEISADEWEAVGIYLAVAFRKKS
ncbi:mRNA cap guanine-N7 methyltransferase [Coemansia sp. RSA 1365]|nr:mRNA cap guanine-N7 methyltransferase [Coemansia sp. RSA 1365]